MINLSIIICTYNRLNQLKNNIEILEKNCKCFVRHVYVIDNASNLPKTLENDFVSIIYNKNLGGSGGYARGMFEAQKDSSITHIMLMDDDISFDPNIFKKAIEKLNNLNNDDWLSFAMRTFDNPNKIYENTAFWTGIRIKSNFRGDSISKKNYKTDVKNNYAGWWSLIMPISVIKKYGYPMPYFIKSDDIEYGLRRTSEKIIYDNSISVLHEDFNKKSSNYLYYYNMRNHIITDLLHYKHSLIKTICIFVFRSAKVWMCGKYTALMLYFLGMNDLFKGAHFFEETDLERNNENIIKIAENTKFNVFKFIVSPFIVFAYSIKLLLKHRKLKKSFIDNYKYLTSSNYWLKQFNK